MHNEFHRLLHWIWQNYQTCHIVVCLILIFIKIIIHMPRVPLAASYIPIKIQILDVHYNDVIMSAVASQITRLTIVYSTVYSGADQRKHQSSASLAFVRGIHRGPVNSPHKWLVSRKMFPFDDVIMQGKQISIRLCHPTSSDMPLVSLDRSAMKRRPVDDRIQLPWMNLTT